MTDPKPYLSLAELAEQIPFSEQAIRMLVHKSELREGEHFFRRGRKLVFKWAAVCAWIEGRKGSDEPPGSEPKATADIVPLLRHG